MSEFYYDGPIVLESHWDSGQSVWLKSAKEDLASAVIEALGLDEEAMAASGKSVEVHAHVRVELGRAKREGER